MHYLPRSSCTSPSLKPRHEVGTLNEALVELHTGRLHNNTPHDLWLLCGALAVHLPRLSGPDAHIQARQLLDVTKLYTELLSMLPVSVTCLHKH